MRGKFMPSTRPRQYKENRTMYIYTLMGIITLIGVGFGAAYVRICTKNELSFIEYYIRDYLDIHRQEPFSVLLSFVFLSALLMHMVAMLLGTSCIGAPIIVCLPLIKGLVMGCIAGYLYNEMGIKGAMLNFLMFWLPQLIQTLALIAMCANAFNTSRALFNTIVLKHKTAEIVNMRLLVKVFVFTSLLLLLTSVLESALSLVFAPILIT